MSRNAPWARLGPIAVMMLSLLAQAGAQTLPSMLYVGTLDAGKPKLDGGEYFDILEYESQPGETVLAYLHSTEVDTFLALLDPLGEVVSGSDDGAGTGTDAWLVAELRGGKYTFVVTTAFAGEVGAWQLFVASGLEAGGQVQGSLEEGRMTMHGGVPAHVHLLRGTAGETLDLAVDSDDFDAMLLVAAPDGSFSSADDSVGTNPRLTYTLPTDGIYPVFVRSYDGRTGRYRASLGLGGAARSTGKGIGATGAATGSQPAVAPLAGNTWIFQTMAFPSGSGAGLTNEFVSGFITLFPAGRYEMRVRIGDFDNHYAGAYAVDGEILSLEGYGDVRFAQSGVRATFWDGAGSIYGLALEGSCEGVVCATR